ncbi:hypothetical protein [Aquipuribacter sp. MA13-6]|uniref:hypothetical protein n=1 Tax=unclassified Aquipuribacter TaxID=2635084 RepID=UPI003EEEB730
MATGSTLAHVWSLAGSVVAPATLVSAVLFYFGYVSARAQFRYFGVDVDTLGFSTQDFVMRAPQPLLVPALVLLLGAAALTWGNGVLRRRLGAVSGDTARRTRHAVTWAGALLTAAGVLLLLGFSWLGSWPPYPLVVPVLLGVGAGLLALVRGWAGGPAGPGRTVVVLLVVVVVASVFWTTATLAQWSGTGAAKTLARDLTTLPAVVVDTTDPLFPGDEAVVESTFPTQVEQTYRYRYRGLRLLAEGDGRLFLVPERWSSSGSTYAVPMDEARVRFRFVDDPP